jgi:hypothetical protein
MEAYKRRRCKTPLTIDLCTWNVWIFSFRLRPFHCPVTFEYGTLFADLNERKICPARSKYVAVHYVAVQYVAVQYADSKSLNTYPPMKMGQTECSERSEYKIRRRGITQKKAYNIQNTAKVWNQEDLLELLTQFCLLKVVLVLNHHQPI